MSRKLRDSFNDKNNKIVWKLTMFVYRKLQKSIMSKAIEYKTPIIFVNPKNTSSKYPRYQSKIRYIERLRVCRRCGFKADKDVIGAINIWLKVLEEYAGVSGSP